MPHCDFPINVDFSGVVSLSGKEACGAALYINGKLMDVVALDQKVSTQNLLFWGGRPIHIGLLAGRGTIIVRVFSETEDWTKHTISIIESNTIQRQRRDDAAYVEFVSARNYDGDMFDLCVCYTPEGLVGYLPKEQFPEEGYYPSSWKPGEPKPQ
jgi:hypothetical protein